MISQPKIPPAICVVGFHHARGPEIETWFGVPEGTDPAVENDWSFLPFMALSDGAHTFSEDFSYFTLRKKANGDDSPATSLFGMSCTRQLDARDLIDRPDDVTRSTVQKSVVIVAQSPHLFPGWREKLGLVTRAWFMQRDFRDMTILKEFQQSLKPDLDPDDDREQFMGLSLRELVYEFRHQALVLFKCCLLQPKMLFFGARCERLCMMQFGLISLIPGLIRHLEDCADPELDSYEKSMVHPSSLKTSDRNSLLSFMGLPLQIFGKGGHFGPYTPLQQLDMLTDLGTKSYIVGSTNSLLLQQKDRYSDIIINLDDTTLNITSASLRSALSLTHADRRWIDFLHQKVALTWDPDDPSRPTNHGYVGSEEFIRLQFEEYLLALLAATKYHRYLYSVPHHKRDLSAFPDIEGDPSIDFGETWLEAWKETSNYKLWDRFTDSHLFDIVDPRHPTAGALTIDDINRRLTTQIEDLHLEERFSTSREAINKHLASGKKQVSTAFNNLWADIEAFRSAQRAKAAAVGAHAHGTAGSILSPPPTAPLSKSTSSPSLPSPSQFDMASNSSQTSSMAPTPTFSTALFDTAALRARAPDLSHAQAAVGAAGQKASAYFSSWGAWANERRKGWGQAGSQGSGGSSSGSGGMRKLDLLSPGGRRSGVGGPTGPGAGRGQAGSAGLRREAMRSAPAEVESFSEKLSARRSGEGVISPASPRSPRTTADPKISELATEIEKVKIGGDGAEAERDAAKGEEIEKEREKEEARAREGEKEKPEPRSPTKRGERSWGRRREEKGSDGIGRLDA